MSLRRYRSLQTESMAGFFLRQSITSKDLRNGNDMRLQLEWMAKQ